MSDEAAIRRDNLRRICRQRNWTATDLHQAMDPESRYTYWRDLLADTKKSFGERIARRIESTLDLGRGALDEPHPGSTYGQAREAPPGDSQRAPRGPFTPDLMSALARCEPAQLRQCEDVLRSLLGMQALSAPRGGKAPEFRLRVSSERPTVGKGLKLPRHTADSHPTAGSTAKPPRKKGRME